MTAIQTFEAIDEVFHLHARERLHDIDEYDLLSLLHTYLSARVLELMNSNFELLMATLYRIDVSEAAVKQVFKQTGDRRIAEALADLIIDRQKQKAETRVAYKNGDAPQ